jgi:hypothetical protein
MPTATNNLGLTVDVMIAIHVSRDAVAERSASNWFSALRYRVAANHTASRRLGVL